MIDIAYAMAPPAGGGGAAGGFASFVPLILMFVIFYFLLIRPQQKKAKQHREMIGSLKKGDRVVTNGGLHGRIVGLDTDTLSLEVAPNVRVKISRGFIGSLLQDSPAKQPAKGDQDSDDLKSK
ncbi:preprotein translocase subunit YajC [Desulfococcus sp.]|uniref:preprotein translocase subunit YajC n=1 Tax=Desulfococcus sp. TaxID=2025834 RepID=UPI0035931F95